MLLGGVGDALGYKNGKWEFCKSGEKIHAELAHLGGVENITVKPPDWMVSDDTVLHLATGSALRRHEQSKNKEDLYVLLAEEYKTCMADMAGREAGATCIESCRLLDPWDPNREGYRVPFNEHGGGCGAAIRAMCIGLRYSQPTQLQDLTEVAIEAGRMTHHHPTGYLGSLATALFASYAIQMKPIADWGVGLLSVLPSGKKYIASKPQFFAEQNLQAWDYFELNWLKYLRSRCLLEENSSPVFPPRFDVSERERWYKEISYAGWGGSSGHDATIIAYDALLGCHGDWKELGHRAMFHGGDSDSTGSIAGSLFGAVYGFDGVPERNYKYVEFRRQLEAIGNALYILQKNDKSFIETTV